MTTSLSQLYTDMISQERELVEKTAAANRGAGDDMMKVAAAYDQIGRDMAKDYVLGLVKSAMEEGMAPDVEAEAAAEQASEPEEEELARRKAEILAQLQAQQAQGGNPAAAPMPAE